MTKQTALSDAVRHQALQLLDSHWDETRGWCVPSDDACPHRSLWDSAFHAVAWSELGDDRADRELRAMFAGQLPGGMVPHLRYTDSEVHPRLGPLPGSSSLTGPPFFGHALAVAAERGRHNPELVARATTAMDWLWRKRRDRKTGLIFIVHPWEAGNDNSPRWDDWGSPAPSDEAARAAWNAELMDAVSFDADGAAVWSSRFVVAPAAFNAYVAYNMTRLGQLSGDEDLLDRAADIAEAIDEQLWRPSLSGWVDLDVLHDHTGSVEIPTADGLLPTLVTEDPARAEAALAALEDPDQFAGNGFAPASVARSCPAFDADAPWRGATTPDLAYLLWLAACRWQKRSLRRELVHGARRAATTSGWSGAWNPATGAALSAPRAWSALLSVMR